MMICKADFEDLFPDLFDGNPRHAATPMRTALSDTCLARWVDDGGRVSRTIASGDAAPVSRLNRGATRVPEGSHGRRLPLSV
ncbi:hypothetical protein U5922_017610 [Aquicoccus sp. G2-2]|uniref:hypothetical protein n=1 Tax=Aquicoccus sp. G2-2 TaxID=3092120 RepID=UPI002AE02EA7|nr:hypothetical protein [Aquicoccus sp. G2-2]MEA1115196.1 hypothetical protein [Aquicoccus sp. G2-2]